MRRRAFTLTELLIVISIIGMLASISLGALYAAKEAARKAKTQSTITKIDRIIQEKYSELPARRLIVALNIKGAITKLPPTRNVIAELGKARVGQLRWLAKSEMPDHATDVSLPGVASGPDMFDPAYIDQQELIVSASDTVQFIDPATGAASTVTDTWSMYAERTATAKRLYRQCLDMTAENDNAELLYMIVSLDVEDREQFQANETGDIDGDGKKEFLDAWGNPIKWLRWPVKYPGLAASTAKKAVWDHDILDVRKNDPGAYWTKPLIWSNGPDGKSGLTISTAVFNWKTIYSEDYGDPVDASHPEYGCQLDNITNYDVQ